MVGEGIRMRSLSVEPLARQLSDAILRYGSAMLVAVELFVWCSSHGDKNW